MDELGLQQLAQELERAYSSSCECAFKNSAFNKQVLQSKPTISRLDFTTRVEAPLLLPVAVPRPGAGLQQLHGENQL